MINAIRRPAQLVRIQPGALGAYVRQPRSIHRFPLSRCLAPQHGGVRRYATHGPNDPKTPKDDSKGVNDQPGKAGKTNGDKQLKPTGKNEKDVIGDQQKPSEAESQQPPSEDKMEGSEDKAATEPARSKLTKEEEEQLDRAFKMASRGISKKHRQEMEDMIKMVKETGIPKVLREALDEFKTSRKVSLGSVSKFVRAMSQIAWQSVEREEKAKQKTSEDPGPEDAKKQQDGKQKGQEKSGPNIKGFELKLDTGTMIVSAIVTYMLYRTTFPGETSREITWQEFRNTFLGKGLVERVVIVNQKQAKVYLHRESVAAIYPESPATDANFHYYFSIGSVEAFERRLEEAQNELEIPTSERIPVAYKDEYQWLDHVFSFLPALLLFGLLPLTLRRAGGGGGGPSGIFGMGRSRAKKFNHETDVKVKFSDVAGMDEAKQEIMEFVSFLKEPGIYQKLGAKIPRGAILSGPPGTGKTLLAKATAGESQVPFYSVSGSEFVEMFVGVGASRVRDLFAEARKNTPCIVFIDEIDAIGKSRAKQSFGGGNDEREATLNQILTEMDGFNTSEQVVVLAGTNRPDVLDQALMRPGRFDRHIAIDKPTMDGRRQIFGVHLRKIVTNEDIDQLRGRLAAMTPGFSGADIANCVNEAALIAARGHASSVTIKHFEQAIERVIGGLEKKSLVLSPEEKKTVAYHEAGHAICGWFLQYAPPLLKVSIIPRGSAALGYAQYLPAGDTYLMNVRQLMDRMAMTLGGRVSEELHFDTVTSGASDDFKQVTRMATAMVTKWGMSDKIGHIYYEEETNQQFQKPFSEETSKNIDSEVRRIVSEAYKLCKDLLTEKRAEVGKIAEELLTKEMLTRDDMVRLLGKRPFEERDEFSKYFGGGSEAPGSIPAPPVGEPRSDGPPAPPGSLPQNDPPAPVA